MHDELILNEKCTKLSSTLVFGLNFNSRSLKYTQIYFIPYSCDALTHTIILVKKVIIICLFLNTLVFLIVLFYL